ncbi:MAG: NYN domain-containing protein [Deltaproteobacteria bacterium]|nr:NYN domain-containing protein [Deltaproteobacteria bacterium]
MTGHVIFFTMMLHVIIDGYNLIRQIPDLERHERTSLEAGRQRLVALLAGYKKIKRHNISVVFDGDLALSEFAPAFKESGIHIRFSPRGISADDIIKGIVAAEKGNLVVVSSDHSVLDFAKAHKKGHLTSPEFYDKLLMASAMAGESAPIRSKEKKPPHKRWATYKKGPKRRTKKKDRKNLNKLGKL